MNERDEKREQSRTRKHRIVFRVDDDELKFIQAKMMFLGIKNREAYLRKMAIDGNCIRQDYSAFEKEMRYCNYLVNNIANNVNQIAKRINSINDIYEEDIEEVKRQVAKVRKRQTEIMRLFVKKIKEDYND